MELAHSGAYIQCPFKKRAVLVQLLGLYAGDTYENLLCFTCHDINSHPPTAQVCVAYQRLHEIGEMRPLNARNSIELKSFRGDVARGIYRNITHETMSLLNQLWLHESRTEEQNIEWSRSRKVELVKQPRAKADYMRPFRTYTTFSLHSKS